MRTKPHSHPCQQCGVKVECCGDIEQNYDGWPEWICREFHVDNRPDFFCEACAELVDHCDDDVTEGATS